MKGRLNLLEPIDGNEFQLLIGEMNHPIKFNWLKPID